MSSTTESNPEKTFDVGPTHSHNDNDSKDQRSLSNRVAAAGKAEKEEEESSKTLIDPLAAARSHGNEPSRGAKIDAMIQEEEQEELKRKGKA